MDVRKKLLPCLTFLLMAVFFRININVQAQTVLGTVTDAQTNAPLPGVNVVVKETPGGTATDKDGKYSVDVSSPTDTLAFSFIGYQTREVPINGRTNIDVTMQSQAFTGEELVVTAMGIKREERSLSYSAESVNTSEVAKARNPNVMVALQGKVAGLSITQSSAGLGAPARVVLRGNRSISGNNQPLYIVDGVPIQGNPQDLNPDNIASMNVMKGANAAALYGSEAQNGAIVIETKMAEAGEVEVSLNSNFMLSQPVNRYQFQNAYGQGTDGVYNKKSKQSWGPKMEGQMVETWSIDPGDAGEQYAFLPQPDNVSNYYKMGYNLDNTLSVGFGSERTQTRFSITQTKGEDILPKHDLKKYNVFLRINSQIRDWISVDGKLNYINQGREGYPSGSGSQGETWNLYTIPRNIRTQDMTNYDFIDEEGNRKQNFWRPGDSRNMNPYWVLNRILSDEEQQRVIAMSSLTLNFTDALNLMFRGAFDGTNSNWERKVYNDTNIHGINGEFRVEESSSYELNTDFLLSYNQDFTETWNIKANLGGNIKFNRNRSHNSSTGDVQGNPGLVVPNLFSLSNSLQPVTNYNPGTPTDKYSLYASGDIGWKDAIYLNLTGRNDWSSTLPADSRSYFYPSVGVSVILSDIIPTFPELFDLAKVRASWAKVGSSAPYGSLIRTAEFTPGGRNGFIGLNSTLPNEDLKPEETESFEVGLDMRFLEGRLGLDISAYKGNTRNQLFTISVPVGAGYGQFFTNGGNVENKGLEFVLNSTPVNTRALNWNFAVNFSLNRSEVLSIHDQRSSITIGGAQGWALRLKEGEPWGNMYTLGYKRDDQGRVIVGKDGVPTFTESETVLAGNFYPDWAGGISNTLNYKNFSLHFFIDHQQGGELFSHTASVLDGAGFSKKTLQGRGGGLIFGENFFPDETAVLSDGSPNNIEVDAQTFWTQVGGRAYTVPEPFIQDATYTRLREASIGYSLPQSMLSAVGSIISNVEFSVVGRNLFYIYKASSTEDPDLRNGTGKGSSGRSAYIRPSIRSFGANLSIDF